MDLATFTEEILNVKLHFLCSVFKKQQHGMMLSYVKPLNEKMREQLVKIWEKRKNMSMIFQRFQIDDMNIKKETKPVFLE